MNDSNSRFSFFRAKTTSALKNFLNPTLVKYFFSYFLIFSLLFLGSFFIVKKQLANRYFEQLNTQAQKQLENCAAQLNSDIIYLSQVHASVVSNIDILLLRYKNESSLSFQAMGELQKYDDSNELISSIIYKTTNFDTVLSTNLPVTYEDGFFRLYDHIDTFTAFDPRPYMDSSKNQLISVSTGSTQYLIYLPPTRSESPYILLYILDTSKIQQSLGNITSSDMPAIALVDEQGRIAGGVNEQMLTPYLETFQAENGIRKMNSSDSLCVQTGIGNGYSFVALISNEALLEQINTAFSSSYLILALLGFAGFFLMLLAIKITYMPLYRLIKKIAPDSNYREEHIKRLDSAFLDSKEQNHLLQNKLDMYRLSMQKSLLDSVISSKNADIAVKLPNIDQFFDADSNNEIFILCMESPGGHFPYKDVTKYFLEVLPGDDSCILLDAEEDNAIFLLNYTGAEQNKSDVLVVLLTALYEEQGYLSALSNNSNSPLDIPSLYENAKTASAHWSEHPVIDYNTLPPASASFTYPHETLARLTEYIKCNNIAAIRMSVAELFHTIDSSVSSQNNLPNFFVRCVLIDMLTALVNAMNQEDVKFKAYSDLYYETLYFCRSFPYSEKREDIVGNVEKLICIYEQEVTNKIITPLQLQNCIEASYCNPDFSIAILADSFHVSIAYMSYLVKKELDENFSTYLWNLRFQKARDLLKNSTMSIDEISVAVGYINTKSFRRKFKQETGVTPSAYRTGDFTG